MDDIQALIALLLIFIPIGTGLVLGRCLLGWIFNPDDGASYKKRMINGLIFLALAESAMTLVYIFAGYFNL